MERIDWEAERQRIRSVGKAAGQKWRDANREKVRLDGKLRMRKHRANKKRREKYATDENDRTVRKQRARDWINNNHARWLLRQICFIAFWASCELVAANPGWAAYHHSVFCTSQFAKGIPVPNFPVGVDNAGSGGDSCSLGDGQQFTCRCNTNRPVPRTGEYREPQSVSSDSFFDKNFVGFIFGAFVTLMGWLVVLWWYKR